MPSGYVVGANSYEFQYYIRELFLISGISVIGCVTMVRFG